VALIRSAHYEFLLRPRLDLQPIRRPLSRPVKACFSFRDDSFETFLFRKLKEVFATSVDVAADLDASYRSNNLLQALPPKTEIYGYLLGGIGYALFGSSRHLAIGPTSAISLMVGVSVGILSALFHRFLKNLPRAVLAVIVLVAIAGLINYREIARLWRVSRLEFTVAAIALIGVLLLGILTGVLVAAIASILLLLRRVAHPHIAFLGRIPGTRRFSDLARH
jgi:MFS superfamily sulfate permease-like transporter